MAIIEPRCTCGRVCADIGDLEEHVMMKLESGQLDHGLSDKANEPERWSNRRERERVRVRDRHQIASKVGLSVDELMNALRR